MIEWKEVKMSAIIKHYMLCVMDKAFDWEVKAIDINRGVVVFQGAWNPTEAEIAEMSGDNNEPVEDAEEVM